MCVLLAVLVVLSLAAMPASAWDDYKRDLKNNSYKEYWNNGKMLQYDIGSWGPYDDIWSAVEYKPTAVEINRIPVTGKVYTRCEATDGVARQASSTFLNTRDLCFFAATLEVDGKDVAREVLYSGFTSDPSRPRFDIRITQS